MFPATFGESGIAVTGNGAKAIGQQSADPILQQAAAKILPANIAQRKEWLQCRSRLANWRTGRAPFCFSHLSDPELVEAVPIGPRAVAQFQQSPNVAGCEAHLSSLFGCETLGCLILTIKEMCMSEETATKAKKKDGEAENLDPVHVIRKGAIAASIWQRQSPSGYAYYDFSLSRSWKSMSSEKMGYSRNFFETNQADLFEVIQRASAWITEKRASETDRQESIAA